jgi:hypothetical protein
VLHRDENRDKNSKAVLVCLLGVCPFNYTAKIMGIQFIQLSFIPKSNN